MFEKVRRSRMAIVPLVLAGVLILGACSGDSEETVPDVVPTVATEVTAAPTEAPTEAATDAILVTAVDYGFEGLPAEVAAGSKLALPNSSATELHELVAIRLPDGEERSVEELLALSEEEVGALLGAAAPAMVLIALPEGGEALVAVGDGTLTEAGRYIVLCAIPVGASVEEFMAAVAAGGDGPPDVAGGPPHFAVGMYGEVIVQ
ncbi:MAG: hypothetical protein O2919_04460 [Chloroflexi bacterium]|nr:hypothetical protein [Chloroflexota bacterium]